LRLLKDNRLRLLTDAAGRIEPDPRGLGLYLGDTRYVCRLELRLDGHLVQAQAFGRVPAGPATSDRIALLTEPAAGLRLRRRRTLGGGLSEELSLARLSGPNRVVRIGLSVGFDAADIFEIRGYRRRSRGEFLPGRVEPDGIRLGYLGLDERLRVLRVVARPMPGKPVAMAVVRRGRELQVTLEWSVPTGVDQRGRVGWLLEPLEMDAVERACALEVVAGPIGRFQRLRPQRRGQVRPMPPETLIRVDDRTTQQILDRSLDDLHLLGEDGPGPGQRFVAAGLPWFAALFGRDALLTACEAIAFRPDLAADALTVLADHQADLHTSVPGARPGQILHELRTGEMARLGMVPFGPSFGSIDATPLWLVTLGEAHAWLEQPGLFERLWPHALRALDWIAERAAADPDGFIRYAGRPGALANEGWKDSPVAVCDGAGSIVPPPIALVEVQAYVYDALRRLAGMAAIRGESGLAATLAVRARRLRERFNERFWVAERATLAMALGGSGRIADAVASNAGQALWSGIVDDAYAGQVAERIGAPDLDSGWGIRTLASSEPAFDPVGYHVGSVWPHDTALIVGGLRVAGRDDLALGIADRLLEAAATFPGDRLPELFPGGTRVAGQAPGTVGRACTVQAWASAAPLHLVRTLLGLQPEAGLGRLTLERPILPSAVNRLSLSGLAIGSTRIDLEVARTRRGISVRTVGRAGPVQLVVTGR
ncbi:MAG: glycogen debranching N-terminal domain-containing protein, partial [Candidatus Limnocylindrales bacterium]